MFTGQRSSAKDPPCMYEMSVLDGCDSEAEAQPKQLTCTYIDSRSIWMQNRQRVTSSLVLLGHLLLRLCRSNARGADTEQTPNRDRRRKPAAVITRLYATPDPRLSLGLSNRAPMSARAVAVTQPAPTMIARLVFLRILSGQREVARL
jgi:hypothetical protein